MGEGTMEPASLRDEKSSLAPRTEAVGMCQWKKCSMDCSGSTVVKEMWTGVGLGEACMDSRAYMVLETL